VGVIAFDARKTGVPMPHGSGIYVRRLLAALRASPLAGHELWAIEDGGRAPEVVWEQVTLPRMLRDRDASLVHCPDSFLPLRRTCPAVLTVHDLAFAAVPGDMRGLTGWKYRTLVPRAARSAERVICPSRFTADDVSERFGVPADKIRVIPEAPALPEGAAAPPAGPYLLSVGDLRPKKNLPRLIDAYRLLRDEGFGHRLILAGVDAAGMAGELRRAAAPHPLELSGYVEDSVLDALLRGADALVLPSLYEGFGLVALDAMARGCPVVLARAGALPETGGDAAVYFDPHDAQDLADAVRRVIEDPDEHRRLSDAGRAHAAGFSWAQAAAATAAVYEELLG
jgi:glycosyltransferase involved in cell wall biosynthesis